MTKNFKNDFPIFKNNPNLVYLDSTATSQKPKFVIDWIVEYLENNNSSIHRWLYDISEKSDIIYKKSKNKVCDFIWATSYKEIIYTHNSTYALNILSSSIWISWILKKWDKVLLSIVEHHANIVPWLILKDQIWIELIFVDVDENYNLDIDDFNLKYDENVKIISFTHVSNVTGQIFDLWLIWRLKRDDTIFIVDASQSIPHIKVDVKELNCDYLFFTWHKVFSETWIWVLWWKKEQLEKITPSFSWWWAIWRVTECSFTSAWLPDKFEFWTQNISWSVSLMKGFEYIESIWGLDEIEKYENILVKYFLSELLKRNWINIVWWKSIENRVGVFTLYLDNMHSNDVADILAEENIAVRSWKHCAHPLFNKIWVNHSFRLSIYIYNTKDDIDNFFTQLDKILDF